MLPNQTAVEPAGRAENSGGSGPLQRLIRRRPRAFSGSSGGFARPFAFEAFVMPRIDGSAALD